MSKSNYLELEILDHILGGADYARPATVYIALFTLSPDDTGGGSEVSGGSYARVAVTNNSTNFPAAATDVVTGKGYKYNATPIIFPVATDDWGTIVSFAIFDADTSGNMLYYGDLTTPVIVLSGTTHVFNTATLQIYED